MSDPLHPPLPKIAGDFDLMLDVYTHDSLRTPDAQMNNDYGDTMRLKELGQQVLNLAVTYHLFSQQPMKTQDEIQDERKRIVSDENIDYWVNSYGLKEKLRVAPNRVADVMHDPKEMTAFFHIYIGALYIRNGGLPVIQNWISRLITPGGGDVQLPNTSSHDGAYNPQMNQYMQQPMQQGYMQQQVQGNPYSPPNPPGNFSPQPTSSQLFNGSNSFTSTPTPPSYLPPPLPSSPAPYNYAPPSSTLSLVTLALVNQTAAQKSVAVTYPAEQTGPPHQPTWTVRCCMNGIEKGRGVGKSQKVAKEDAARQAWAAMGWGPT